MDIERHFESSSDKENEAKKEQELRTISWIRCQCSGSSQISTQNDLNDCHQFLSLYKVVRHDDLTGLLIYDTETEKVEVKIFDNQIILDEYTSFTQLPNGELFCYGSHRSGKTWIFDRSYGVRILPSGNSCLTAPTLYYNNSIYFFGGCDIRTTLLPLSRKFDLEMNRWINLASLPEADKCCHSVIFNSNILISGYYSNNLWLYSTEIDSFSIIPYKFPSFRKKEVIVFGYHWGKISKSKSTTFNSECHTYCLYNKEKIYISDGDKYYLFDLKKKDVREFKV